MRSEQILVGLDLEGVGLEIGGGYNPLTAGPNVRQLDHSDRDALCRNFAAVGIDTSKVPHINYVWDGTSYPELVGEERFDWIVASHVIEHVPCLITFLQECDAILKPGGKLALAIPDKRCCFDYYRPPSSLARIIDARGSKKPTPGALAEMIINASAINGDISWHCGRLGLPRFVHTPAQAKGEMEAARTEYRDTHVWVFTPNSFRLLIHDLRELGFIKLGEIRFTPSTKGEFYIQLAREGIVELDRLDLARAATED